LSACSSLRADVIFVVDSSGSIESSNFRNVRSFVANVVDAFDISSDKVRVGLIEFSDDAYVEFDLEEYSNKRSIQAAIAAIPYYRSGQQTRVLYMHLYFARSRQSKKQANKKQR